MIQTPLTKALRGGGLSGYEIKCYVSLLERDALTPPQVAKVAGIARPSAYDALEKLMSKGLCISKPGDVKKYSACDPALLQEKLLMELDEAAQSKLEDLHRKGQEILQKTRAAKEEVSNAIEELKPQYENSRDQTDPLDYIEIRKDPYQIHKRFMQLISEAKQEILGFTKPPYSVPREKLNEQTGPQIEKLKRGVRIKNIYEMSADQEDRRWLFHHADVAVKLGAEVRVLKRLPMKMFVFDSRVVLFSLEDPVSKQPSITSAVVEHRALAESLRILFETLWEQAEDYHILKD